MNGEGPVPRVSMAPPPVKEGVLGGTGAVESLADGPVSVWTGRTGAARCAERGLCPADHEGTAKATRQV